MADISKLKFLETHEWVKVDGKTATVGISEYAQNEISDIVFIELPKPGRVVKQKESTMVIESVKAAFDIYSPVSGKVTEVNTKLSSEPQLVNQSPWEKGWLYKIELAEPRDLDKLMDSVAYEQKKSKGH